MLRTCQQCNYPMCDHVRLCDTHYRHTWPPTHSPWHHNYKNSSIFIFPEHGAEWHTCEPHPQVADTVLMSLLIGRSVTGLITSVMTFQPMRNCFARHLSMLQNRNIFFIIFFHLAWGPLCPTLKIAFRLHRSVILSFKPCSNLIWSMLLYFVLVHSSPLPQKTHLYQQNPSASLLGWRYCDFILVFWYDTTIKSLATQWHRDDFTDWGMMAVREPSVRNGLYNFLAAKTQLYKS